MIHIPRVRVVDENGQMLGEMETERARLLARERGLDLVEVAPESRPPVCKILDYGKFKYAEKKKKAKAKSKQHAQELKEVRLRPLTGRHDLETKLKHARGFLEQGDKVLFTVFFRGREQAHKEIGREMMARIARDLEDVAKVEHTVSQMGPRMHMTLMPKPGAKVKAKAPPASPQAAPPAPSADGTPAPKVAGGQDATPVSESPATKGPEHGQS
ncbi:MAG: translation initiation factor IF-3 [Planctomycetes bacterium]|nr:translation initiation factor IF-3 [Planctomycetota bacterium]